MLKFCIRSVRWILAGSVVLVAPSGISDSKSSEGLTPNSFSSAAGLTLVPLVKQISEGGGDYPFLLVNSSTVRVRYPLNAVLVSSGAEGVVRTQLVVNSPEQGVPLPRLGSSDAVFVAAIYNLEPAAQYVRKVTLPAMGRRGTNRLEIGGMVVELVVSGTTKPLAISGDLGVDPPLVSGLARHWDCQTSIAAYGTRYSGKRLRVRSLRPTALWSRWRRLSPSQCSALVPGLYEIATESGDLGFYFGVRSS